MRFPLRPLRKALTPRERTEVRRYARGLLRWQATLRSWPRPGKNIPDATPFVSLYARGALRGCYGADEGPETERLARAFVLASADARFGGATREERGKAMAQVAYLRDVRRVDADRVERELEVGVEGIALVDARGRAIVLLPSVAREGRLDVDAFVKALADKSNVPRTQWAGAGVFLFRTEEVPVRRDGEASTADEDTPDPLDAAATHLAALVDASGEVAFALQPRTGARMPRGEMHHGRAAVAIRALAEHGGHAHAVLRARARLQRDVAAAMRGGGIEGWPGRADVVAGTLALVSLAGVDVRRDLRAWVEARPELASSPWHAAQAIAALGKEAPSALWEACVKDLDVRPWAPWTAIAARARGEDGVLARCASALEASIRAAPPHRGGCSARPVPEVALTAVTVEALAPLPGARAAIRRARAFLRAWQVPSEPPAPLVYEAAGAFLASPILEALRVDITGHAMLALR
jgi:AMMECR1 domain-containing protein